MHSNIHNALAKLYATWMAKIDIVIDQTQPTAERLAALHWIDTNIGEELTPAEELEDVAAQLRAERGAK